jgi:hypothetical protein
MVGALIIFQGKEAKNLFKPILQEYRDAEAGVTQGIVMD